jgi:hypothetical protein
MAADSIDVVEEDIGSREAVACACALAMPQIVEALAKTGADLSADHLWRTLALGIDPVVGSQAAAAWSPDRAGCARVMLAHGADIHGGVGPDDDDTVDPLYTALLHRHADLAGFIMERGGDPWRIQGLSAALIVTCGHSGLYQQLLDRASDPALNAEVRLTKAAVKGHEDDVRGLVSSGVHPDTPAFRAGFPLLMAIRRGHVQVAKVLVEAGADVATDARYDRIFKVIFANGRMDMLAWLASRPDGQGYQLIRVLCVEDAVDAAIEAAIEGNSVASLDWLVGHGAIIRPKDVPAAYRMRATVKTVQWLRNRLACQPDGDIWWQAGRSPDRSERGWWKTRLTSPW